MFMLYEMRMQVALEYDMSKLRIPLVFSFQKIYKRGNGLKCVNNELLKLVSDGESKCKCHFYT